VILQFRSTGREGTFDKQHLPVGHSMIEVYAKGCDGGTAGGRQSDETRAVPTEMPSPFLAAWVEKRHDLLRLGVKSGDIRSFEVIAGETGKAEVIVPGGPTVASGDYVVDLEDQVVELVR